jgi:hypothetical protein
MHKFETQWPSRPQTIVNLEHRLDMSIRAAEQALLDLNAARIKQGLPVETPDATRAADAPALASDPASVANFILRADRRRRGLEPLEEPPVALRAYPKIPEATAPDAQATAAFILAADKKRRGDT